LKLSFRAAFVMWKRTLGSEMCMISLMSPSVLPIEAHFRHWILRRVSGVVAEAVRRVPLGGPPSGEMLVEGTGFEPV
jgi:hypothetical protein